MLAELVEREADWADVLFLVAAIIFAVAAVLQRFDNPAALALVGWCALAVGLLVL